MSSKPNLSKDGSFIDFKQSENVPTTAKKFRQSAEIQGFYSFVYDNALQQEAYDILTEIMIARKAAAKHAAEEAAGTRVSAKAAAKGKKATAKVKKPKGK